MSKQDRQGVRTPADVERKYKMSAIKDSSRYAEEAMDVAKQAMETAMGGGSGLYVLELTDIEGTLTDDQYAALVANAPNVVIKMSGLYGEGICMYLPLMLEADGMCVFVTQMDMLLIAVMVDCTNNTYAVQISEASQGGGSDNGGDNTGSNIDAESILTEAKSYANTVAQNAKDEAKNYAKSYTDTAIANALSGYVTEIDNLVGGGL